MLTGPIRRTMMEVPGNVPRMLKKSYAFEADLLMLDLEDSVPATDRAKADARRHVGEAVAAGRDRFACRELLVRINRPGNAWCLDDLELVVGLDIDGIIVPKAYSALEYKFVEHYLELRAAPERLLIHLAVETPGLLLDLPQLAKEARRLTSLMAGGFDYTIESGSTSLVTAAGTVPADAQLSMMKQTVLAVARANDLSAVDALLSQDPDHLDDAEAAARRSRELGFDGVALFRPALIEMANRVFSPSSDELAWADATKRAADAAGASDRAAVVLDGRVILVHHVKVADALMRRAGELARTRVVAELQED